MDATVAECVRCFRSEDAHQLRDQGDVDEVQRRIWQALGWPCPEFTLTPSVIYARNQAATSRWARRPRPAASRSLLAATASAPPAIAVNGAAAARAALARRTITERTPS